MKPHPGMTGPQIQGRPRQQAPNTPIQDLLRLLPRDQDAETEATRESVLEAMAKDILASDPNVVSTITEQHQSSSGNQVQGINAIDLVVTLEQLIHQKYPDTQSMNYKGMSKKLVQGLKSRPEQRQALIGILMNMEVTRDTQQMQIEDFFNQNVIAGAKPQSKTAQDNSGSAAVQSQSSNPFAFPRPGVGGVMGGPGGPSMIQRRPPGPQNRPPQQRFAAGNFFNQSPQAPAINIATSEQESAIGITDQQPLIASTSDQNQSHQQVQNNHQEQERPSVHQQMQHNNQRTEEIPTYNFADSGAAGSIHIATEMNNQQRVSNPTRGGISSGVAAASGGGGEDYFGNSASPQLRQQQNQWGYGSSQQKAYNPLQHQFSQEGNEQVNEEHDASSEYTSNHVDPPLRLDSQRPTTGRPQIFSEDQSRGADTFNADGGQSQRLEFEAQQVTQPIISQQEEQKEIIEERPTISGSNNQFEASESSLNDFNRDQQRALDDISNRVTYESGINLEEGGQRVSPLDVGHASALIDQATQQMHDEHNQELNQMLEKQERYSGIDQISLEKGIKLPHQHPAPYEPPTGFRGPRRSVAQHANQSETDLRGIQRVGSSSQLSQQQQQIVMKSPSMRGLMHQASRPPQSVASVNITNLEDSEGIIRAYKKKKAELEDLKEKYYIMETDYFTEKQRSKLYEEDVSKLRGTLNKAEKQLKEVQLKESRKDSIECHKNKLVVNDNQKYTQYQRHLHKTIKLYFSTVINQIKLNHINIAKIRYRLLNFFNQNRVEFISFQ